MRLARTLFVAALAGALVGAERPEASQTAQVPSSQGPTFRSSVELTTLDVTVVDSNGLPLTDLRPADFTVRIDGKTRRVVRAEWVPLTRPATSPLPPPPPAGYSSNEGATPGRLIVIAIDQPNIRVDGASSVRFAVNAFIDRLEPSDQVAAVALGGGISTPFTTDRESVKQALARMSGDMRVSSDTSFANITASEAIEIVEGRQTTIQLVVTRECGRPQATNPNCPAQIAADAQTIAMSLRQETDRTILSLQGLFESLRQIDAPKTLVLVSEGFAMGSQLGGVLNLGSLAAAARTTVYALRLDDRVFDASSRRPSGPLDRQLRFAGLDLLTSISKGWVFEVVGMGSSAFERLEREISGYYVVGVESTAGDLDGKAHPISVQVGRRGALVRARRELGHGARTKPRAPSPLESVAAALSTPLVSPGLPLRVATFSLRDQDPLKIQVLIHADIGSAYTSAVAVAIGYVISDTNGAIVTRQVGNGRLAPPGNLPASLPYTATMSLAPGEYVLKLAVAEGGHVGSVEHPIHAGLIDAGSLKLSELMIGDPADARELGPTVSFDINSGELQGYIETYGGSDDLLMRYEIAPTLDAPSVVSAVVTGRSSGDGRMVFSYIMPVSDLPPGSYVLRATLSSESSTLTSLKKVARAFRVVPTAPAATGLRPDSAAPPAASSAPGAARGAPAVVARPFRREELIRAETLQPFREIVAAAARTAFEAGVAALTAGDFVKAELSFKSAQRETPVTDNSAAPLTYLAATYAAFGHDLEASIVWQTALIDGEEYPQIFEWLADALIRIRSFDQARSILNEATEKWPGDTRFTERLAALPPPRDGGR